MPSRLVALVLLSVLAVAGCGGENEEGPREGARDTAERSAVEKAAREYIVEQQSNEDDTERLDSLAVENTEIDGDSAEVEAKSSATGNRYEARLRGQSGRWTGLSLVTDRPSERVAGDGDPSKGPGKEARTNQLETQIRSRLLKPLGIGGKVVCPPTIKLRRGNNFDCKVTGSGRAVTVQVTQKDAEGSLNYKVTAAPR